MEDKNISVGKFNDVEFHHYGDHFGFYGAHFGKNYKLIGTMVLMDVPVNPAKRINIRLVKRDEYTTITEFKDVKKHAEFKNVKKLLFQEYDSHMLIKVVI